MKRTVRIAEPPSSTNSRPMPTARPPNIIKKGITKLENWHAQRALEYSNEAYKLAMEAHGKSGQIVSI